MRGDMPPCRSISASCRDVLVQQLQIFLLLLLSRLPEFKKRVATKQSSQKQSVWLEGFSDLNQNTWQTREIGAVTKEKHIVPGRSLTQWRLRQVTIASWDSLGIVDRKFSSSALTRSTSTKIRYGEHLNEWCSFNKPSNSEIGSRSSKFSESQSEHVNNIKIVLNSLLESSMTTFLTLSSSSNFEKWPEPQPRSRIVLNVRLISYEAWALLPELGLRMKRWP
jgi:hypothetical protein